MGATVTTTEEKIWNGGNEPMKASYGKMMMWFFILSDALTFTGFLAAYGFSRYKFMDSWPIADEVFNHFPFLHGHDLPMLYVALMTFVLIFSSVTMVLAVDAGHHLQKSKVTIIALGNKFSRRVYSALTLSSLFEDFPLEREKLNKLMNKEIDTTKENHDAASESTE